MLPLLQRGECMNCIHCGSAQFIIRKGFYTRPSDGKRFQRYYCKTCKKRFSERVWAIDYRYRKRRICQLVFRSLAKGVSQRTCAFLLDVTRATIARRVVRFGEICEHNLNVYRQSRNLSHQVMFDELETFVHTKCKPLTVPIAVGAGTRKVLALGVGSIAAKGKLADISRRKYGPRKCQRRQLLNQLLKDLKDCTHKKTVFHTDKSQHYSKPIKYHFPMATHNTTKGRRGCVVGQGELKRGGHDPLFSLNHTYAMFRDNLKTLSRRTWCTVKKVENFRYLLFIYAWLHNQWVEKGPKRNKIFLTRL